MIGRGGAKEKFARGRLIAEELMKPKQKLPGYINHDENKQFGPKNRRSKEIRRKNTKFERGKEILWSGCFLQKYFF